MVSEAGEPVDATEQDGEAETWHEEERRERRVVDQEVEEVAEDDRGGVGQQSEPAADQVRWRSAETDEQQQRQRPEEQEEDWDKESEETTAAADCVGHERRQDPGMTICSLFLYFTNTVPVLNWRTAICTES